MQYLVNLSLMAAYRENSKVFPIQGVIKKFSDPSASDYQGLKICSLLFNIIPLQGNANVLSPSPFGLAYPFQIDVFFLVPQVLIHCLYDAFIASYILVLYGCQILFSLKLATV